MESEGRDLEAQAWHGVAARFDSDADHAARSNDSEPAQRRAGVAPGFVAAVSRFPIPDWNRFPDDLPPAELAMDSSMTSIAFVDSAAEAGLHFRYVNSGDAALTILHMQETYGGGVAVLDYDADGWADVYLPQGGEWPPRADDDLHIDRLFRNMADGGFQDATDLAGIRETGFSQGATVGDFDNDGFPDLYVANVGRNTLLHNNGDGTFTDVSNHAGPDGEAWTTSCLMADLDGDAFPDLYTVNYLSGEDVFTRICLGSDGQPAACSPDVFDGAPDELFLNLGDGRFVARSDSAGVALASGKGLGVVAADFEGTGRLNLFIANDQVANFYHVNQSQPGSPTFVEQGVLSGLAFDREGTAQACMGIAADDCNADGRCDLFITNFYNESNTLYVQQPGGAFADGTASAELRAPSYSMLGFGTQFLDADLDGRPDLMVANGHVTRTPNAPYRMRPQFFRNVGGRFEELPSTTLGPYFGRELLGRALATLDWNRDGRTDVVVTHLDDSAALLTNRTAETGHRLIVRLAGVRSARDAIGAIVRVRAGGDAWVRQLTAGDGFQASNQRQIVLGLGDHQRIDELDVQWPLGGREQFHDLHVDAEYLVVEGRGSPILLKMFPGD
jgi:hypothetical protein